MTRFSPSLASLVIAAAALVVLAVTWPGHAPGQIQYMPGAGPSEHKGADSTIAVHQLAPGVYAAKVRYVWTGWVELPEGILLVDTALDDTTAAALADTIRARSGPKPFKYVVSTHAHEDHIGGNRYFIAHGATVMAQTRSATRIDSLTALQPVSDSLAGATKVLKPAVRIDRRKVLGPATRRVEILWLGKPAHTAGDLIVYLPKQKVLFAGDLVSYRAVPWMLDPAMNREGWMKSLDSLLTKSFANATIVPGHGVLDSLGRKEVIYTYNYLRDAYDLAYKNASWGMHAGAFKDWGGLGGYEDAEFYKETHFMNIRRLYNIIAGKPAPGRPWMRAYKK